MGGKQSTNKMQFTFIGPSTYGISSYYNTKRIKNKSYILLCSFLPFIELIKSIKNTKIKQNIIKYNLKTEIPERTLTEHTNPIMAIVKLNDNEIAIGDQGSCIRIWNLRTGECQITAKYVHRWIIYDIIKLNESHIASGSGDHTIKIWNFNNFNCIRTLDTQNWVWCLEKLDNKHIVSGGDFSIKIWDYAEGQCIITIKMSKIYKLSNKIHSLAKLNSNIIACAGFQFIETFDVNKNILLNFIEFTINTTITCLVKLNSNLFVCGDWNMKLLDSNLNIVKTLEKQNVDVIVKLNLIHFASGAGQNIHVWDFTNGNHIKTISTGNQFNIKSMIKFNSKLVIGTYSGNRIDILNY